MDNIVGNRIFAHLIGLPPVLIERASVAAQVARIKTFESVRDFFSGSVFLSMLELPFVAIAALAIYAVAGPLVLVPVAMVACYALLFWIVHKKVKVLIRLAAKTSSARQQFAIETFEKIQGVRGNGLSKIWESKFRDLSGREMVAHFKLNWIGLIAPTGTPEPIIAKLHTELTAIQDSPELQKQFANEGAEVLRMSAAGFGDFIASELAKWGRVVKEGGIKPQ